MRILVLAPVLRTSGISRISKAIVGEMLARGHEVRAVAPVSGEHVGALLRPFSFPASRDNSGLETAFWPESYFRPSRRDWLVHEIEKELHVSRIDRVVAFDVKAVGYAAALSCHAANKPFSVFASWADAFIHHMDGPHEMEAVSRHARHVFACSPLILRHLQAFHRCKAVLLDASEYAFRIVGPVRSVLLPLRKRFRETPYVVTTGVIDERVDVEELVGRVRHLCYMSAMRWRHLGTIDYKVSVALMTAIVEAGLMRRFDVLGPMQQGSFLEALVCAACYVKPYGGEDTSQAFFEAMALGVPASLPEGHWLGAVGENCSLVGCHESVANVAALTDRLLSDD